MVTISGFSQNKENKVLETYRYFIYLIKFLKIYLYSLPICSKCKQMSRRRTDKASAMNYHVECVTALFPSCSVVVTSSSDYLLYFRQSGEFHSSSSYLDLIPDLSENLSVSTKPSHQGKGAGKRRWMEKEKD